SPRSNLRQSTGTPPRPEPLNPASQPNPGQSPKTWAVHRIGAQPYVDGITQALEAAGNNFIDEVDAPQWVTIAAHQSGITLPATVSICRALRAQLESQPAPETISGWTDVMLDVLKSLPYTHLSRVLPAAPYGTTSRLYGIFSNDAPKRVQGWTHYRAALHAWLSGKPMISIAQHVHPKEVGDNAKRGSQDPLPRMIAVAQDAFRFGLPLVAGSLTALTLLGRDHDTDGPWNIPEQSARLLNLLPLAIRSGADSPEVLGWMRAGVYTRVAAHQLNALLPAPEGQSDDQLRRWANGRLHELYEGAIPEAATSDMNELIAALRIARDAR
ncbi:hypothetical protein, partial [Actinoplanes sp. NPDC026619]|uniref:hypothetical protein n=1 Tax=Actinoplanes sp. NPDC026619 TaxID=3155798 RepID=UPI0033C9E481